MKPFHPQPEALPDEIAIFPLSGALLLPWGRLPLNIFEPRYLAMTEDALANGRMLGMIQGDPARGKRPDGGSQVFSVGCLGRLSSFAETEDGRLLVTLTGVARFRVVEEIETRRGYRRIRADYAPFLADLEPETLPVPRNDIMTALRPYFAGRGMEVNWEAIEALSDAALVTTLCMVCPFSVAEKQALLEADTLPERAGTLATLLRMAVHDGGDLPPTGLPS
ncbi:LON peptidase substrate-binding domain-containing protein [Sabulicella glaciei]|uniref:LON peptidase substrate-binding domain-containing protein n=1 Tax=Sabulicella glaciei TaxID=2984948 RepID=A0ABT3P0W0_9PROT|nr:LON peptidase substrate-binding domain-containing protein [Roseococcus sp. MDT2-1-1]